jgi:type IV pilus assembly protein PilW
VPQEVVARGLLDCYRTFCTPSGVLQAREEVERIEAAFDALPDDYREVITLSRIVGLSHAEIAERSGRSEGATRTLLYRALGRLAEAGYTDGKTYSLGTTTLGPFNDNFKRHVFSSTVRLNNISGRRETP